MEINQVKQIKVNAKTLKVHIKVCDSFSATLHDSEGLKIGEQENGYVPEFFPGQHYGDYLILDIDIDSGQITNWTAPTPEDVEKFIAQDSD